MIALKDQLPDFYQKILPQDLLDFSPQETLATCHQCRMAKEFGNKEKPFYKPDLKCCTFEPFIPNFLVGAILNDPDLVSAHEIIRGKIELNEFALPIGLVAPLAYQIRFHQKKDQIFGQNADYLCSFYERTLGTCQVWKYRGNVCTTFICKSSYGKKGIQFWQDFGDLLSFTEQLLMEEVLVHLDFSPRQISEMLSFLNVSKGTQADSNKWRLNPQENKKYWNFYPDPVEFYLKCFALAQKISQKDFYEIGGESGQRVFDKALKSFQNIRTAL